MNIVDTFIKSGKNSLSMDQELRISRRGFLAGLIASPAVLRGDATAVRDPAPISPIDLGDGLEIRDYRLFPTEDVMRFIVEIHNATEIPLDTPSVGVVLPNVEDGNFGWANPISPVLHPHSSDCLIGVAPSRLRTSEDWGTPDLMLCDGIESQIAESIQEWEYEYSYSIEIVSDTHTRTTVEVTNLNDVAPQRLILQGLVRDGHGRLVGSLLPISLAGVAPGETKELIVNSIPDSEYLGNPFALIDSVIGVQQSFSVQPRGPAVNVGCNPAMPWNR